MPKYLNTDRCRKTGKIAYASEADAAAHLAVIKMIGPCWRNESRAYCCPFCKQWHLTSKTDTTIKPPKSKKKEEAENDTERGG